MQNKSILHPITFDNVVKETSHKKKRTIKVSWKIKTALIATMLVLVIFGIYKVIQGVNNFFENNTFVFRPVVEFQFNRPLSIIQRVPKKETIVKIINELKPFEGADNDIEKYICEKFGAYDCKTAIAIARAESGSREQAWNANENDSIDVGVFQINSIHFTKPGCSLKEVVNYKANVDCAYTIFKASGWNPWTVYKTGSFTKQLNAM